MLNREKMLDKLASAGKSWDKDLLCRFVSSELYLEEFRKEERNPEKLAAIEEMVAGSPKEFLLSYTYHKLHDYYSEWSDRELLDLAKEAQEVHEV